MANGIQARIRSWSRLDNAAKIFPPTSHGGDTGVFRLSCELRQLVRPELLQSALDETMQEFPHMGMALRRGVFWYYLEQSGQRPMVVPETQPPCAQLYTGSRSALFQVSWWNCKINLDVFHVLTDGVGAVSFLQELVTRYLALCFPQTCRVTPLGSSAAARQEDGFDKYYRPHEGRYSKQKRAYQIRGEKNLAPQLTILEGVADVSQVLAAAHRYDTTLTVYLCAVLLQAIREGMTLRDQKRPVVLTVPVDLRSYFKTDTARNFFGIIRVSYDFQSQSGTFEDMVLAVSRQFKEQLTAQRLAERMNALAALERNVLLRGVPLFLKNPVLRLSGAISAMGETATLSNIGRVRLPAACVPYVKGFGVFMSTRCTQLCVCTFENSIHMGFTSALYSSEVQRRFFRRLLQDGVELEVRSNDFYSDPEEREA